MTLEQLRLTLAPHLNAGKWNGTCRFVGGCVRDDILAAQRGLPAPELKEADISVELRQGGIALAQKLLSELPASGLITHPSFGTAALGFGGITLEFAMTRSETYSPGKRHPRVRFAGITEDALRRDFTLNAIYMDISTGKLSDPTGNGINDLEHGVIRCLIDPDASFNEDPLRILRAIRFAACLGFSPDPVTEKAMRNNAFRVNQLSVRAFQTELSKILASGSQTAIATAQRMLASIIPADMQQNHKFSRELTSFLSHSY